MSDQLIHVSIELGGETIKVGKIWFCQRGVRQSASFEYERAWLKCPERFALDPALGLTQGVFHTAPNQTLFGAIGDSEIVEQNK